MKILYRYVVTEIFRHVATVLVVVLGIYLAVEFFERIDNFMDAGLPVSRALLFLLYRIPFVISQTLPLCVCLSVLITFGMMNKHNEIIAIKSLGISAMALIKPVVSIGMLFTVILMLFNEVMVPVTAQQANRIWLREVKNRSNVLLRERNIWLKDQRSILNITFYNRSARIIHGVTLFQFDEGFQMAGRIDADRGRFRDGRWVLENAMEQSLNPDGETYQVDFRTEKTVALNISPESLDTVVKKSEEMGISELYEFVRQIEAEGYDATPYRVDLYAKIAFPFVCLILSGVGMGIALLRRLREGIAVSIAVGLGIAFLYWICYSLSLSMGYGAMLPPFIAAWATNFIFFCITAYILLNVEA